MTGFVDHLLAEIQALETSLENDPRYVKLRELQRIRVLYAPTDSLVRAAPEQNQSRRPAPRTMAPETKAVVDAAREYMSNRSTLVPLRELYHEIAEVRGIPIGGKDPINNLSAMLWRYGFRAEGRTGWRLRETPEKTESSESGDGEPEADTLFSAPEPNGAAHEMHGAATLQ